MNKLILTIVILILLFSGLQNVSASNPCVNNGGNLSDDCVQSYLDYMGRYMTTRPAPHYGDYTSPNGKLTVRAFYHVDGAMTVIPRFNGGVVAMYVSYTDSSAYAEYLPYTTQWKKMVKNIARADCKQNNRCHLVTHN